MILYKRSEGVRVEEVNVTDYNAEWINDFEQEKAKIKNVINDITLGIEHIGSTAVPGLGAKPVIDMMVGVKELSQVSPEYIVQLKSINYEYVHKPEYPERLFFRKGQWRAGTHHLHVYVHNGEHWLNNIWFRDYLRSHPKAMDDYYRLKKQLEGLYKSDRVAYTNAKAPFIQSILSRLRSENHT